MYLSKECNIFPYLCNGCHNLMIILLSYTLREELIKLSFFLLYMKINNNNNNSNNNNNLTYYKKKQRNNIK